jgi:bacillithiol synthase
LSRPFAPAWRRADPHARDLLPGPRFEPAPASRPLPTPVVSALYDLQRTKAGRTGVERLAAGAPAVVTGQQLGFATGPLLTLAKAWSAVSWARHLSTHLGSFVVPVFWLQTEDHDLDEVRWVGARDPAGRPIRITVPGDGRIRCSVGARLLPEGAADAVDRLLGPGPEPEAADRVRRACAPGRAWVDAFADLIQAAVPELVLLDPRAPAVQAAVRPVYAAALERHRHWTEVLKARARSVEGAGFRVQVPVRPETLCFFHPDGPEGPRYRLRPEGADTFRAAGDPGATRWSLPVLQDRLDRPGAFSTSALLRTLTQDTLLRVAAVVVGPSELAYWAQVEPLHTDLGLKMPAVVLRDRVQVLEPRDRSRLERWGLQPDDLCESPTLLVDRLLARDGHGVQALRAQLSERLRAQVSDALAEFDPAGADLSGPQGVLLEQLDRNVARFTEKVSRMRTRAESDAARTVQHLRWALFPEGVPQERHCGWAWYAARHGASRFDRALADAVVSTEPRPDGPMRSVNL